MFSGRSEIQWTSETCWVPKTELYLELGLESYSKSGSLKASLELAAIPTWKEKFLHLWKQVPPNHQVYLVPEPMGSQVLLPVQEGGSERQHRQGLLKERRRKAGRRKCASLIFPLSTHQAHWFTLFQLSAQPSCPVHSEPVLFLL